MRRGGHSASVRQRATAAPAAYSAKAVNTGAW
jgi:hypothetical protein